MTPAERLRAAATRLREVAGAAPEGPWRYSEHGNVMDGPTEVRVMPHVGPEPMLVGDYDSHSVYAAIFASTVHPGVALALADWLDKAGADEWSHGPHCLNPCDDCDDDPRAPHIRSALAVADAVLGGGKR